MPLHEWAELEVGPGAGAAQDLATWLFEEGGFAPAAKLSGDGTQSVVCDHLGTPLELYDAKGRKTWQAQLDAYGTVREGKGRPQDCPFRYPGQYEDAETGLYYNRFRYYDPETGHYISQDPIRLGGGITNLYGYVLDTNTWVDEFGLSGDGCGLTGKNWTFDKSKDVDFRGTGKTYQDALDEAFRRTGVPKEEFTPTKWERTVDGKTIPTEYVGPNGANINMYIPECNNVKPGGTLGEGPHQPHIGYQTPGKGAARTRGHIFVDNVPATRR